MPEGNHLSRLFWSEETRRIILRYHGHNLVINFWLCNHNVTEGNSDGENNRKYKGLMAFEMLEFFTTIPAYNPEDTTIINPNHIYISKLKS